MEASRALSVIVDGAGADDPATMAAGLATLQASLQGGARHFRWNRAAPSTLAIAGIRPTRRRTALLLSLEAWPIRELLSEFCFAEAADHLTTIETQLLKLEHEPGGREAIDCHLSRVPYHLRAWPVS